jgi:hypothetical protein
MTRTLFTAAFLAAALLLQSCGQEQDSTLKTTPPKVKIYGVANGKIQYEYSGAATGSKTTIFANYGMYQRQDDEFTFNSNGQAQKVHSIDITSDSVVYAVNLVDSKATKSKFDFEGFEIYTDNFSKEEKENFQAAYILRNGGKEVGTEEILDRECKVYEMPYMGMKLALWNGLTLKSTMVMGQDTMYLTATSIDTDYKPTAADFLPPSDVQLTDLTQGMPPGHPSIDKQGSNLPEGHPKMAPMRRGKDKAAEGEAGGDE